jgi:FtsH-binding integral membrane protein
MNPNKTDGAISAVAKGLLRQRDEKHRSKILFGCIAGFIVCFFLHSIVSNSASPLKLIPQTGLAFFMGYLATLGISLYKFRIVAEFIDWEKVEAAAK